MEPIPFAAACSRSAAAEQNSSASHGVRKSLQRVADVKRKNAITKVGAAITRSKTVALASRKRISMRVGGPTVGRVTFVPPPYPLPTGKIQLPALYFMNCEF
ncbi:hypothetical protein BV898_14131 [Hypsibius exemplaris]|uniref:Uncharacterized protein n=1 Tax=Hypsibius exemplaris TaxID=2072580 RepID=A0A1W0W8M4_HYPEX|nr:hypothetical protein BV898_14131 [Hypsibius exemplaris]